MKRALSIFLICTLFLQYFNKLEVFICFQLNKKYISAFLCENISKPEMKCDGKCYMKKQLKATEEGQNKLPSGIKEFQEINFFFDHSEKVGIKSNYLAEMFFAKLLTAEYISPSFSIFHPPKAI